MTFWLAALLLASCTAAHDGAQTRSPMTPTPSSDTATPAETGETGAPPGGDTAPSTPTGQTGDTGATAPPRLFAYVGTDDDLIHVFTVDPTSGALTEVSATAAGANPSFLAFAPDQRNLYAVNEGSGELAAFSVDGATGGLTFLDRVSSNGDGPAHLAVDATGGFVLAANYGEGNVTAVAIDPDGSFGSATATRDTGPNAHQIVLDPTNQFAFVPNLGADNVSQLLFDPAAGTLAANAVPEVALPAGSGPRHLAFHPTSPFAYVIGEHDDTLTALSFDAATGRLAPVQTLSTLPAGVSGDDNFCAEVAFEPSGRFLYGTNRGHDSLVIYEVDPATGLLTLVGHESTGGSSPRHFSISPAGDLLVVANQRSSTVVSFRLDPSTGALTSLATTPLPAAPAYAGLVDLPL